MGDLEEEDTWSQREEEQVFTDEETDRDTPPWPGYDDSSSYYGGDSHEDELEPEPPDCRQDSHTDHSTWSSEEESEQEGDIGEDRSWQDETESQVSLEEGDHKSEPGRGEFTHEGEHDPFEEPHQKPWCEETDSQISLGETDSYQSEPYDSTMDDEVDCEPRQFYFSGHKQGPEAYLQWENEMENWFRSHNIPKENRLSYAFKSLNEEASTWWEREELMMSYYCHNLNITWGDLKQRMYREYVQKSHNRNYMPKKSLLQATTRRWTPTPKPQPVSKSKKACCPEPKNVSHRPLEKETKVKKPVGAKEVKPASKQTNATPTHTTKPKHEPQLTTQPCKSSKASKINDTICYRCHKRGHFAAVCPERQENKTITPEPKLNSLRECLENSGFKFSNSDLMHLSLPRVFDAGLNHGEQHYEEIKTCQPALEKDEVVTSFITLQEEPPDDALNPNMTTTETKLIKSSSQVSPLPQLVFNNSDSVALTLLRPGEPKEKLILLETNRNPNAYLKSHVNEKLDEVFQNKSCSSISSNSMTVIMHLLCSKEFEKDLGTQEEQLESHSQNYTKGEVNGETNCEVRDHSKGPTLLPKEFNNKSWRGVIASSLIEEAPPDSQHQLHPSHNQDIYRGNSLNPQRIQNTNLTYLRADYTILRTKFTQGGGYDEVIKPEIEPKLNQTGCTTLNRPVMDICSLFEAYHPNHKDSTHEITWRILSAQLRNISKKNQTNRSSYEGVIQFTNQLILHFLDLDMRALIGGFPPNQKELCYKSTHYGILVQKRSFSNLIQDYTKFGLGVIQFLKQRMLDLPYLEAAKFGRWQTRIWRPGEILDHLRNLIDHFPCTSNHWMRQILSSSIIHQDLPYLDSEGIKPQRLLSFSLGCELKTFYITNRFLKPLSMHQDVPRLHHFQPKISRYKLTATFSIWTDF